ncbi:E3 ubiquitin-protein ligase Mdm2 isoform X2 [Electrophorus electricus]|uniref:E3 ubiquitin-protein ligase Mdm2 n=2 Tax=Electrophorus electricus TaxID=8005 RepID=A0A4W4HTH0_ELEEL|nr:E3 ubiquitin-protein ligase Mdm2 isoform X2 [Electrophorus electricus]
MTPAQHSGVCTDTSRPLALHIMSMATESCLSSSQINKIDNEKLVRPKVQLQTLLKDAGADKDVFTMKEVMFYLGKYIMSKELYDKQQQHIVHCGNDALGTVLGVSSFSVKEPRALFAMISKNLIAVKNPDSQTTYADLRSQSEPDPRESNLASSTSVEEQQQQRRRRRSSESTNFSVDEESGEPRKRHKSDSFSLTFDDSLSWCVIGGLHRERGSSESSETQSNSDVGISHSDESEDSESDNFSVEFEVESIDSDAYSENDDDSIPGEDEVYEVTIFAEDEDSFDVDPEITEADYWKCSKCDELNPPLPRHCKSCWTVRSGWLPDMHSCPEIPSSDAQTSTADSTTHLTELTTDLATASDPKLPPTKPFTPVLDPDEGLDVPDGKCSRSQALSRDYSVGAAPTTSSSDSQGSAFSSSQPSTSSCGGSSLEETPELERFNSLEACLPATCLEPCVICQSRPKNGCIVHGRTGHLMACYTCAKKLKNRNKLCPVCREPIQSVVLTYVS